MDVLKEEILVNNRDEIKVFTVQGTNIMDISDPNRQYQAGYFPPVGYKRKEI